MKIIAHKIRGIKQAKEALKAKADFIEIDVSKPFLFPKFVIQHDGIKGKLGIGPVLASIFIPKVKKKVMLDIKHAHLSINFAANLSGVLDLLKIKEVRVCGTNWKVVSALSQKNNLLPYYTIARHKGAKKFFKEFPNLTKAKGFSIHYSLINKELINDLRQLYSRKIEIWAWTVNDLEIAKRLKKFGVDGIITDRYEEMLKIF